MEHHSAFGLDIESLDIVIVDDSKTVLTMIRSMISSMKVARVRSYDRGDLALQAILQEPPNVILTDLAMSPMSGMQLIRLIRQQTMEPLCFIPVIVITAHATQARVAQLFEVGAHHVLAKPLSSAVLQNRLKALSADRRVMRLEGDRYVIDGMREVLAEKQSRLQSLDKAREFHEEVLPKAKESQREADEILRGFDMFDEDNGRALPYASSGKRIAEHLREARKREESETPASNRPQTKRYASVRGRSGR
ncbi:response regulator [uncultured Cohaesibacter sp.]|uniref:response regulator n=1 Tax=uncultured Cohaesibacter sp. TaxID=1002546 RepID=UPI0029C8D1DE|nr:response regulator [uncultured Cohaesibacter sp.]